MKKHFVYITRKPLFYDEDTFYFGGHDRLTYLDTEDFDFQENFYY